MKRSTQTANRLPLLLLGTLSATAHLSAATFTVTNVGDSGAGSFRQAIVDANANPGADLITFSIPGDGPHVIKFASALPDITDQVTIDGYTQGDSTPGISSDDALENTNPTGALNTVLKIQLDGQSTVTGLIFATGSDHSVVRGLAIGGFIKRATLDFTGGITILSNDVAIAGCFVGTDTTGSTARANEFGASILGGSGHRVGGSQPQDRNLISGNTNDGLRIQFSSNDTVAGNLIGTNPGGTSAVPNATGVVVFHKAADILIGGNTAETRNVISGNTSRGVAVVRGGQSHTDTVDRTFIKGNYVGLDPSGTTAIGNGDGIEITAIFGDNAIGGTGPGEGNVISGNVKNGILLGVATNGGGEIDFVVRGNFIGTTPDGRSALGNGADGISDQAFAIGLNNFIDGNIISGNGRHGLYLSGANITTVQNNHIGTDGSGAIALGNAGHGIFIEDSDSTYVGDTAAGSGNTIAYNGLAGISLSGSRSSENFLIANSIHSNGGLGIDLNNDGVTANDADDPDGGSNGSQNFPVMTSAVFNAGKVRLQGTLNTTANMPATIEFFGNGAPDSSGFGEGRHFLGSTDVTTDGSGNAAFDVTFPFATGSQYVTATAAGGLGTSEFSQGRQVVGVPAQLLNISTRMQVGTDPNQLIGGFIVTGTEPKKVIILATGPSLAAFGITGALADPVLELYQGNTLLASNDNWKIPAEAEIEATGIKPSHDLESALVRTLAPGAYTAVVRGTNGTGIGTVQVYDLSQDSGSKLANISSRGFVEAADSGVMIAGFIIGGIGGADSRVIVRGLGPSLTAFGIAGALADPTLELKNSNGATPASNDEWQQSADAAEISSRNLAPGNAHEAALAISLPPGAYTAIVRGKAAATGVAVVEVYNVE